MKFRVGFSTVGAGGSIPAKMKAIVAMATASLALFLVPALAFAEGSEDETKTDEPKTEAPTTDTTTNPTDAQYAPPTSVVPPSVPTVPQVPAPPKKQPEQPVEQIQAGLGAGGAGQPAERVAVPTADSGPSLPFTGLDVAALIAVALALTGTGVVLRRLATNGDAQK
jgi:hypothetical protein